MMSSFRAKKDAPNPGRLDAALRYANAGWPVFPCRPGSKEPALPSAHPDGAPARGKCAGECGRQGHGLYDATTDPEVIISWFAGSRNNVGLATGSPGPDVLDVDEHGGRGNGFAAFNRLKRAGLVPEPLAVVRTPSGGFHVYFRADPGRPQGNGSLPEHHIDFRGTGGYVVAPPSTAGGRPYEVVSHQASDATFDWGKARDLLAPPQASPQRREGAPTDVERLAAHVARLQPGNRNGGLYWAASRAAEAGVLDDTAAERLVAAALTAGIRGGEREARRTVGSARRGRGLDPTQQPQREREAG